jgi:hypothetical protein
LSDALKFTVRYQRKVQPAPYENLTIGLEMEFPIAKEDINIKPFFNKQTNYAFKIVRNKVEEWIHESLNSGEKP